MTVSKWANEFIAAGRAAGKSDSDIASAVREVRSHCVDGAEDPYDSFGTPEEYLRELGWNGRVSRLGLRRGRIVLTATGFVGGLLIAGSGLALIEKGLFGINMVNVVLVPFSGILIGLMVEGGRRLLAEREVAALLGICIVLAAGTSLGIALGLVPEGEIVILPRGGTFLIGCALVSIALLGRRLRRSDGRWADGGQTLRPTALSIISDSARPANDHRSAGQSAVEQLNKTGESS